MTDESHRGRAMTDLEHLKVLPWMQPVTIETRVRRLRTGTFLGRPATAWDDSGAQWDGETEVVATEVSETITGRLLGAFPEYGTVRMDGRGVTTEATIKINHAPIFRQ